ncbi:hypothetical protein DEM27_00045 [Metarhizobium album]|uniref:HTH cro/C1-type domain-containing protein n=1 Tax=Metarhizobium album TaxID=2182425 RepID=A0A2U2DYH3_9HYPH|nr:hypothetical protein DEM27_00045 [Rhizobium album]
MTLASCALRLGVGHARNFQKYETGENRPDAPMIDRIIEMTGGAVTLQDMHEVRLEWLREHKPDVFIIPAIAAAG